jgi:hypothetical protein
MLEIGQGSEELERVDVGYQKQKCWTSQGFEELQDGLLDLKRT